MKRALGAFILLIVAALGLSLPAAARADSFQSDGDLIQGWYWLRDGALVQHASWRIDNVTVQSSMRLLVTALATDKASGGPGFNGVFRLRYGTAPSVMAGEGGTVITVKMRNTAPAGDPLGYLNTAQPRLTASALGPAGSVVTVYLRAERLSATHPHIAFNQDSMAFGAPPGARPTPPP